MIVRIKNTAHRLLAKGILAITLGCFATSAFSQGIAFEHDTTLAAIKAKARKANKPIFIDGYTTWCGPCKWMAKNIFPNDTVGRYFNENFICVKFDMEKGDGKKIAAAYKVNFYPTFLFLDTAGKELHRGVGAQQAKAFIETAKRSQDPETRFGALKERYKRGERNPAFIRQYLKAAGQAGEMNMAEAADWYFAMLPDAELITKENFEIMEMSVSGTYQPAFKKLFDNREKFASAIGKERVNARIRRVYEAAFNESFKWNRQTQTESVDEKKYADVMEAVQRSGFEEAEKLLAEQNLRYLKAKNDWSGYVAGLKKTVPAYYWNNAEELNSLAWEMYERAGKQEELELGLSWSKRSLELADNHYNNDTHAALCYKLKRKKEALKYAEKALEQARKEGENTADYEERLQLIKKM